MSECIGSMGYIFTQENQFACRLQISSLVADFEILFLNSESKIVNKNSQHINSLNNCFLSPIEIQKKKFFYIYIAYIYK